MPNKYSHSGVLAQYCKSGLISLPENLYSAYIRASSVGSLTIQSQQSIASRDSSTENENDDHSQLTRPHNVSLSSTVYPAHHDERGRGRTPVELPQFPFSHKPNPQERATLITSFMNEIDHEIDREIGNEPLPNVIHQPHSRKNVDSLQRTEPQKGHGILIQESSDADPSSHPSRPHRHDRNAWKSTYPPVSHSGNSSASLALSAASSGEYALDIPSDFALHVDGATATPQQTRIRLQNDEPVDASVAEQDSNAKAPFLEQRPVDGQEVRQASENVANFLPRSNSVRGSKKTDDKPRAPPRSANRPPSRQESDDDDGYANAPTTVTKVMLHPASSYASVSSQKVAERPRNSSRSRSRQHSRQKNREDHSLYSISDSASGTGIEVVDNAAVSSDYNNHVKIPEHEAAAITRLSPLQHALPAGLIIPREASSPPAIGSNETRKIQPRRGDLNRPVSATSSDTQIYAPLSSAFPDEPYTDEPAFLPKQNVVGPGSLPESAIESSPEPSRTRRSQPRGRRYGLHAQAGSPSKGLYDSSTSGSDSGSVGLPTVQPSLTSRSTTQNRNSKYTPVYRDRKQEWLDDPSHTVGHYRAYLLKRDSAGHKRFASGYSSRTESREGGGEGSVAQRLNSLPSMTVEPKFSKELGLEDVTGRPVSVLSEASASTSEASSGFYPPDIPRYREEAEAGAEATPRGLGQWPKQEDSAVVLGLGDRGGGEAVGRNLSSSDRKSWRKKDHDPKERDRAGQGLLRRLRGVSLSGI